MVDLMTISTVFAPLLGVELLIVALIDFKRHKIPNFWLLTALVTKICWLGSLFFFEREKFGEYFAQSVTGFVFLLVMAVLLYKPFYKTVGAGDFKLLMTFGFCVGFPSCLAVMVISLFLAVLVLILSKFGKLDKNYRIPFAPVVFLAYLIRLLF